MQWIKQCGHEKNWGRDRWFVCTWQKTSTLVTVFFFFFIVLKLLNPLHPNISIHILSTVRYTHPKLLKRRICFKIKSFFFWWSFSLILVTLMCDIEVILYREISCQALSEIKYLSPCGSKVNQLSNVKSKFLYSQYVFVEFANPM